MGFRCPRRTRALLAAAAAVMAVAGWTAQPAVAGTLTVTKTVSGSFQVGGTVTYTVVITENSGSPQGDNPGSEMTDVLPPGVTLVSASSTSGVASTTLGTNTVQWNGAIAANGSVTVTITATVNPGTEGKTIANTAQVNYDTDQNGTNESSATSVPPASFTVAAYLLAVDAPVPAAALPPLPLPHDPAGASGGLPVAPFALAGLVAAAEVGIGRRLRRNRSESVAPSHRSGTGR